MSHTEGIVHSQNNHFISFTEEVSASDITEYMVPRIKRKEFQPGTHFILVAGTHHGKNKGKVEIGKTDFVLLQGFYHQLFTKMLECPEVAQIQFYMHFLRKSIRLLPLIKVFHLSSDRNENCTKCKSMLEVSFPKVSVKLMKR